MLISVHKMAARVSRRKSRGRYNILLTGFSQSDRQSLQNKINSLDGVCMEVDCFDPAATHIICKKPSRSEKFLGACATGKWILTPAFIAESYHCRHWVEELPYEWYTDKLSLIPDHRDCHEMLPVPRRCREERERTGQGLFVGWKAAVVVFNRKKRDVYKRLLKHGGATVVDVDERMVQQLMPFELTHLFVELEGAQLVVPFRDRGVLCLEPVYLGDYLTQMPKPSVGPYLMPKDYKPKSRPRTDEATTKVISQSPASGSSLKSCTSNPKPTSENSPANIHEVPPLKARPRPGRSRHSPASSQTSSGSAESASPFRSCTVSVQQWTGGSVPNSPGDRVGTTRDTARDQTGTKTSNPAVLKNRSQQRGCTPPVTATVTAMTAATLAGSQPKNSHAVVMVKDCMKDVNSPQNTPKKDTPVMGTRKARTRGTTKPSAQKNCQKTNLKQAEAMRKWLTKSVPAANKAVQNEPAEKGTSSRENSTLFFSPMKTRNGVPYDHRTKAESSSRDMASVIVKEEPGVCGRSSPVNEVVQIGLTARDISVFSPVKTRNGVPYDHRTNAESSSRDLASVIVKEEPGVHGRSSVNEVFQIGLTARDISVFSPVKTRSRSNSAGTAQEKVKILPKQNKRKAVSNTKSSNNAVTKSQSLASVNKRKDSSDSVSTPVVEVIQTCLTARDIQIHSPVKTRSRSNSSGKVLETAKLNAKQNRRKTVPRNAHKSASLPCVHGTSVTDYSKALASEMPPLLCTSDSDGDFDLVSSQRFRPPSSGSEAGSSDQSLTKTTGLKRTASSKSIGELNVTAAPSVGELSKRDEKSVPQEARDQLKEPQVKQTGTAPEHTETLLKKTEKLPKQAGTISKHTEMLPNLTGIIPKHTETLLKQTGTVPELSETLLKQIGTVSKHVETLPKHTETSPKQTETVSRQTGTVSKQAETISEQTESLPKHTETLLKQTGTIPKQPIQEMNQIESTKPQIVLTKQTQLCQVADSAEESHEELHPGLPEQQPHAVQESLQPDSSVTSVRGLKRKSSSQAIVCDEDLSHTVKKRKFPKKRSPLLPRYHLLPCHGTSNNPLTNPVSLPLSRAATNMLEACLEDHQQRPHRSLKALLSLVTTSQYPLSHTLATVYRQVLLASEQENLSHHCYIALSRIADLHPPTCLALQTVYLQALRDPQLHEHRQREEWTFLHKTISSCLVADSDSQQEKMNNHYLFKLLVENLQKDFYHYVSCKADNPRVRLGQPLVSQLMWPGGLKVMNVMCQELLLCLVDAVHLEKLYKKMELVRLLQTLVAMVAGCLSMPSAGGLRCPKLPDLPEQACLFARELAYRINSDFESLPHLQVMLTSIQLPWLRFKVCHMLLDLYDDSLLPLHLVEHTEKLQSLRQLLDHYMYLVPPVEKGESFSHLKNTESRALQTLGDKNQVARQRHPVLTQSGQASPYKAGTMAPPVPSPEKRPRGILSPHKVPTLGPVLKRKMATINKQNQRGETQLHVACIKNNVAKVKELLLVPGINVNISDYAGWTPLHEVCNHGHLESLQEILKYKPPRKITSYFKSESEELKKLDLMACNEDGITPLHDAVMNDHYEVVRMLLQAGGSVLTSARTKDGQSVFDMTLSESMKELLQDPPTPSVSNTSVNSSCSEMSMSQDFSCSQCSQGPSCTLKSSKYMSLPSDSTYQGTLGVGQGVTITACTKYITLASQLVKSYIEFYDLLGSTSKTADLAVSVSDPQPVPGDSKTVKHLKTYLKMFKKHLNKIKTEGSVIPAKHLLPLELLAESV